MRFREVKGFSIAEMLISLLIVSLVISASIPAITKKNASGNDEIWRWTPGGASAFFGVGTNQTAILGNDRTPLEDKELKDLFKDGYNKNFRFSRDGTKLVIVKKQANDGNGDTNFANSFIDFYNRTGDTSTSYEYAGRIAMDPLNFAIGLAALQSVTPKKPSSDRGIYNTAVGPYALALNQGGQGNTAVGYHALMNNNTVSSTGGQQNTAVGAEALAKNTTGENNTGLGYRALMENQAGDDNTAVGSNALKISKGSGNTALGQKALNRMSTGEHNTALGNAAMEGSTSSYNSGSQNIAIGPYALRYLTEGNDNIAIGFHSSGTYSMTGENNISMGSQSLSSNRSGSDNIAIGTNALNRQQYIDSSIAIGSGALQNNGKSATGSNDNGKYNIAIGHNSMNLNEKGYSNTFLGYDSGSTGKTSDFYQNVGIGTNALRVNTSHGNVAVGYKAMASNESGNCNVALGWNAMYDADSAAADNIAIGYRAGQNLKGNFNIIIGQNISTGPASWSSSQNSYRLAIGHMNPLIYGVTTMGGTSVGAPLGYKMVGFNFSENATPLDTMEFKSGHIDTPSTLELNNKLYIGSNTIEFRFGGDKKTEFSNEHINTTKSDSTLYINNKLYVGSNKYTPVINMYGTGASNTSAQSNFSISPNTSASTSYFSAGDFNNWAHLTTDVSGLKLAGSKRTFSGSGSIKFYTELYSKDAIKFQSNRIYPTSTSTSYACPNSMIFWNGDLYFYDTVKDGTCAYMTTYEFTVNGYKSTYNAGVNSQLRILANAVKNIQYPSSDEKLKIVTGDNTTGLKEISALNVKNYIFKKDKNKTPQVGVIAQQLQKVMPNAVYKEDDGYLHIKKDVIFYAMINAIKELYARLEEVTAKVTGFDSRLKELENQNKILKQQNELLVKRIEKLEQRH